MCTEQLKAELVHLEKMLSLIPTESADADDRIARAIYTSLINDTRRRLASGIKYVVGNSPKRDDKKRT